jgi:hypothetical protein
MPEKGKVQHFKNPPISKRLLKYHNDSSYENSCGKAFTTILLLGLLTSLNSTIQAQWINLIDQLICTYNENFNNPNDLRSTQNIIFFYPQLFV